MKKVIIGAMMFYSGLLSMVIIYAFLIQYGWSSDMHNALLQGFLQLGLEPILYVLSTVALIGIVLILWGFFDKKSFESEACYD